MPAITRRTNATVTRPTTLMKLLTPSTHCFCEIVTYLIGQMLDGVTRFRWKLFSFGLLPPKGEDPVTKNGQIDEHPDVFHAHVVGITAPVTMQKSDDQCDHCP